MKTAIYQQSSGNLWDHKGGLLTTGYSGSGDGVNNPKKQAIKNIGPIPRGTWDIGEAYDSKRVGSLAIPLYPHKHDMLGRSYFRMHGDNSAMNQSASAGCIIAPRDVREIIAGHDQLVVVK